MRLQLAFILTVIAVSFSGNAMASENVRMQIQVFSPGGEILDQRQETASVADPGQVDAEVLGVIDEICRKGEAATVFVKAEASVSGGSGSIVRDCPRL